MGFASTAAGVQLPNAFANRNYGFIIVAQGINGDVEGFVAGGAVSFLREIDGNGEIEMQVINAVQPGGEQAKAFFSTEEDGPFVMVNLLKFKPFAEYEDGSEPHLTGEEAYGRYTAEVRKLLVSIGGKSLYSGAVTGILLGEVDELWDKVALAQYPSLAAMSEMMRSPGMQAIAHHRRAGLAGQLNIRTRPGAGILAMLGQDQR